MRALLFISLLVVSIYVPAQKSIDSPQAWMSKFYRLSNPILSESGKWAAVRKRYDLRQDTLLVVNTQFPNIIAATIILTGSETFLKDDGLLVTGSGKAKFLNLTSGIVRDYNSVRSTYSLPKADHYAVLSNENVLRVFTVEGKLQQEFTGVQVLPVNDRDGNLYVCRAFNHHYQVGVISQHGFKRLADIEYQAKELEVSPSGKQLFVTGKDNTSNPRLTIIDVKNGKAATLKVTSSGKEDFFDVTDVQNDNASFIALYSVKKPESGVVDIWYGNDDNLDAKKRGSKTGQFWLREDGSEQFQLLPNDVYPAMASLNSERYFLAYHPTKGHNFITLEPQFMDTSIYDATQKAYIPLGTLKGVTYGAPEIICSKNGTWIIFSEDGIQWTVFELQTRKKYVIDKTGLRNPAFSDDNRLVFFESENDLWKYDIDHKFLTQMHVAKGKAVTMVNIKDYKTSYNSQIGIRSFESKLPLLLNIADQYLNQTSYSILKGSNLRELIPMTKDKVGRIGYNRELTCLLTLEENFNKPPTLYITKGGQKHLLLSGGDVDHDTPLLKQEIIYYNTVEGLPLKGILYYPVHYKEGNKYPMVVHIYQIQSDKSNEYYTPSYNNRDGLDIRALTKSGYFVLLPDTAVGRQGPGLSALDCVHKALDALRQNRLIDTTKIGLVGHSFGGYETNFIATHSHRFAAYISGAGISDITRSYFSYNYHYPGPYYWQFETGILSLPPFADDKGIYFKNEPIHYVEKVNAPVLLWTGKQDQNVPWDQTTEFFIGLKRNLKHVAALFYPDGRHALSYDSSQKKDLYVRVMEWWEYFLKDKKNAQWINELMEKGAF